MQSLVNGLINGLDLAVLALAFTLVYLPLRILAVALGALVVLAPMIVYQTLQWGGGWWLGVPAALATTGAVAVIAERYNHRFLAHQGASDAGHLIASLGIYIVVVQLIAMVWGNELRVLGGHGALAWSSGGVRLTWSQAISAGVAAAVLAAFYTWLSLSRLGLRLRAMADSPSQLELFGYDTDHLRLITAGLAGVLAGLAGILSALHTGVDPQSGLHALILAIVAVIVGGAGSFLAPLLGGLLVGAMRSQVVWHWSGQWQDAATFLLLAVVLLFRPHGILGTSRRVEAGST